MYAGLRDATQFLTDSERVRTFTWSDPLVTAMAAASLPGLEAIRKIADGELPPPPIAQLLDFEISLVEEGRVIFAFTPAEWMYNPIGSVHGGVAATLLDSSLGCAIHTTLAAGQRYTTSDLQVRYVRAMSADSAACSPTATSSTRAASWRPPRAACTPRTAASCSPTPRRPA